MERKLNVWIEDENYFKQLNAEQTARMRYHSGERGLALSSPIKNLRGGS